jgi:hypothetical protein
LGKPQGWKASFALHFKARNDKMVALADPMLELNKQKHCVPPSGIVPSELGRLEREVASTDREIDDLVYELHGITVEEGKLIEGT